MPAQRTVLVTGASTGIGEAIARRLDRLGYEVFAGVRQPEDGERLARGSSERLRWVLLDVTDPAQIGATAATIADATTTRGLAGLVNNAGIAGGGPLELVPLDQVRRMFEVNVLGLLAVTQAMLPLLRAARGRIVNIGSIDGKTAVPMVGPYGASKHAVEALTDVLRLELHPDGVQVSVIEPGAVRTPIWEKGRELLTRSDGLREPRVLERYGDRLAVLERLLTINEQRGIPPERVADAVVRSLEARTPRTRYVVGRDARIRAVLQWLLPDRWNDALLRAVLQRLQKRLASPASRTEQA